MDKNVILENIKSQWKLQVQEQYKQEPEKVKSADIEKHAKQIMNNPVIKMTSKITKIKLEDVIKILDEIRQEVIEESNNEAK